MSATDKNKSFDLIDRSNKGTDVLGTAAFFLGRGADPFLQYNILKNDWGSSIIERLGGTVLPRGPPLITNTPLDQVGLSPYRSILLGMSIGSMVKQNFYLLATRNEELQIGPSLMISAFNTVFNSVNSLLFICSQTSASVNGEHFPQTPLIVGTSLYAVGMFVEWFSEVQRQVYKKDPANKGKVYQGGLFGLSRHVNYFGYTLWRTGYSIAAGGWLWGAAVAAFFAYDFGSRAIPALQSYMEDKYGEQYKEYEQNVPYKFVPFVW